MGLLFFLACADNVLSQADLQLDIDGGQFAESHQVRLCVSSAGERVLGARLTGRYAFPGLPVGDGVDVGVDLLTEDGGILGQAVVENLDGFGQAALVDCTIGDANCLPCEGQGSPVEDGEDTWLLVVRFLD